MRDLEIAYIKLEKENKELKGKLSQALVRIADLTSVITGLQRLINKCIK